MLIGIVWAACLTFLCGLTVADPDLWGHTLYGLRAIDQGVLVERVDPFSYTAPGAAWINHEWLSEYQFGLLWKHAGNAGLVLWRNVCVLCVLGVAAVAVWRSQAAVAPAVALLVFTTLCLSDFVVFVRPQLATYALFAIALDILRRYWDDPRGWALWMLPPLMLLWTNLHGGFLAGLGITAVFAAVSCVAPKHQPAASKRRWAYGTVLVLSAAATLCNPYGIGLHRMLWNHLATEQFVREWAPVWGARRSIVYFVPFGLALWGLTLSSRRKLIDVAVLAVTAWQAASHLKHVALLCVADLVLLPPLLSEAWDRLFPEVSRRWSRARRPIRLAAVLAVSMVLAALHVRSAWPMWQSGIGPWDVAVETRSDVPGMPARALAVLRHAGAAGNVVTDYGWGQYVLWHLYPACRVAYDGRYRTVYPPALEREFLNFQRAAESHPPIDAILDGHATDIAVLPVQRGPVGYLDGRPDWPCVYRDEQAAVFVRDRPPFRTLIERSQVGLDAPAIPPWQRFPGELPTGTEVAKSPSDSAPGPPEQRGSSARQLHQPEQGTPGVIRNLHKRWNTLKQSRKGAIFVEYILLVTLVGIGVIVGLACVRTALVNELFDLSNAINAINC